MLNRRIVAGRLVRLACLRHVRDLAEAGERGFVFSRLHAEAAILFIECSCRHSKNSMDGKIKAGDFFVLEPWQRFIVWSLFGWRRREDMGRRFRMALIEIARKNGKSTFMSALMLLLLVFDLPAEPGAEIYCVATKEAQAKIVFREAVNMVGRSKPLKKRLVTGAKSITFPKLGSFIQILGSDSDTTDGLNTSAVVADELHEWKTRHRGLFDKLVTAGGARFQPIFLFITTAGNDDSELWVSEREISVQALESARTGVVINDERFAFIACQDTDERPCAGCAQCAVPLPDGRGSKRVGSETNWTAKFHDVCDGSGTIKPDDSFDETTWKKANPNLNVSVSLRYLRGIATEARTSTEWKYKLDRYHLGRRVSANRAFITSDLWLKGSRPVVTPAKALAFGGLDLARRHDFAALALCFPVADEYHFVSQSFTTEQRHDDLQTPQLNKWIADGLLICHKGDAIEFADIRRRVVALSQRYTVKSWAYDPNFARLMGETLQNEDGLTIFAFTQTDRFYNEPLRLFEKALGEGRVRHNGDPVLSWQALNLSVKASSADLWMPDKSHATKKIDAMVALLMAFSECLFHERNLSVYDKRDPRSLGDDD